jgi:hypothetical protein
MAPPGGGPPAPEAQGITAAAPAPADTDLAASPRVAIGAIVAIAVGWVVVLALHRDGLPAALKVNGDMASFALFYVAAQAIERLIEPFSQLFLTTSETKKELDSNVARALTTGAAADGEAAAKKQDELNRKRGERALVLWAVATVLGMLLSGFAGLYFVNAILAAGSSMSQPLDVLVTGLVIGGGSKPLHDLISNVQKTKEKKEDPPETSP